jgi:2-C-methyl-D-erythritol 4-phosphate cytidylyltransferase
MNIALIFAGGTGRRMSSSPDSVPKQFLELYGKPIIVYTLEKFENHDEIGGIIIVCLSSWIPQMRKYVRKFNLTKVRSIVPGGRNGQESIYHGLREAKTQYPDDTIVLVHDGVRPLVSPDTISKDIACVEKNGNAVTVVPATETIFLDNSDDGKVGRILDRSQCAMARAPQGFRLGQLLECHEKAKEEGKTDFIDSASMIKYFGYELYTVEGRTENIKITTPIDFYIFRAIVDAHESSKIFGL